MITLKEAKDYVKENVNKGVRCPCCEGFVKLYKRKINSGMALFLIGLYKLDKVAPYTNYFQNKEVMELMKLNTASLDYSVLEHFGLIQSKKHGYYDHKRTKCTGYWKITDRGREFVKRQIKVEKRVWLLHNQVMGFDRDTVDIKHCLGSKFDYEELMYND